MDTYLVIFIILVCCSLARGDATKGQKETGGERLLKRLFGGNDGEPKVKRGANPRVSFKECNLPDAARLDCGDYGITEEKCYARECCWGESNAQGVPWCYHSKSAMKPGCLMNPNERLDCGWYGIRKEQCFSKGCCWQPSSVAGAPWCYHTQRVPVYEGECGVPTIRPNALTRIVGGTEAVPNSWPWMVSLQGDGDHFCGGSLLNNHWVVSAAHCAPGFNWASTQEIVLGMHSLSSGNETKITIGVEEIIEHEDYGTQGSHDHDIMLIKLAEPVVFSDIVSPVCLPAPGEEFNDGRRCFTTGWGHTEFWGTSPDKLQQVMVPLVGSEICNEWYEGRVDETMVCAGYAEGGRDSCQGDSGGPLVCFEEDKWVLVGVVSWGDGCASENKPGIYSKVSNLVQWVETKIAEHK